MDLFDLGTRHGDRSVAGSRTGRWCGRPLGGLSSLRRRGRRHRRVADYGQKLGLFGFRGVAYVVRLVQSKSGGDTSLPHSGVPCMVLASSPRTPLD